MAATFGTYTMLNFPFKPLGAPGGAQNIQDQVAINQMTIDGIKDVMMALLGGPLYFEGNLGLMERNRPGKEVSGSRIGQGVTSYPGAAISVQSPTLEVVSVTDASNGGSIEAANTGILTIKRMRSEGGDVNDTRPAVLVCNHVCTNGPEPKGDAFATDGGFRVTHKATVITKETQVCWSKQKGTWIGQETGDDIKVEGGNGGEAGGNGGGSGVGVTATDDATGNAAIQHYGLDGEASSNGRMSLTQNGLQMDGSNLTFVSDDGDSSAAITQADNGDLIILADETGAVYMIGDLEVTGKITADFVDPRGYGYDNSITALPAEFTASLAGTYVDDTDDTLHFWDKTTDHILATQAYADSAGGGGGGYLAKVTGVDLTATAGTTTNLYTATEDTFIRRILIVPTTITSLTVNPEISVGIASGETDILTQREIAGLVAGESVPFTVDGAAAVAANTDVVKINVKVAATATALVADVYIWGDTASGAASGSATPDWESDSAATVQQTAGSGYETLKTISLDAGEMGTDGDMLRITAAGKITGPSTSGPKTARITVGGIVVGQVDRDSAVAGIWQINVIIARTGAATSTSHARCWEGDDGDDPPDSDFVLEFTPAVTWANAVDIDVDGYDDNDEDSVGCDLFLVEKFLA